MNLKGKAAVVTGASSGIGKAIATKLSNGCKVALSGRSTDKLKELPSRSKSETMVAEMNVTDTKSVSEAFKKIKDNFGKIYILVNCAGIMPFTYLKNRHLEEWLDTIEINVKGPLRCSYKALPSMKEQNSGHIINIASVDGKEVFPGGAVYGASKSALIALSTPMRMELSPEFNIRITAIEPGTEDTHLREDITDKELLKDKNYGRDEAKLEPEDIANAVYYALSQPESVNVNELLIKPTGKV